MIARQLCFSVNGLLLGLAILATPVPAAIVPVGDVTPSTIGQVPSQEVIVGHSDVGGLTIDAGSLLTTQTGTLGMLETSIGMATVTGTGSEWANSDQLYIGDEGSGVLSIEAGGLVSIGHGYLGLKSGSTGTATVAGAGSKWTTNNSLYVGYEGSGTLTVTDGGQVSSSLDFLGNFSGSTGTAIVSGAGSKWTTSSSLYVGREGSGTLTVADGGQVTTGTLYASFGDLKGDGTIIATQGAVLDGELRFDAAHGTRAAINFGSGGVLTVTPGKGHLGVGYKDQGSLTVADAVVVSSSYGFLGYHTGSSGTAAVTGAGSKWTINYGLSIGHEGSGSLTMADGGQVSTWHGYLGYSPGSTGTVTVTGPSSQWSSSSLYVGYKGSGMLTVADGGQVTTGTLYASLADLQGDGTITATLGAVLDADLRFDATHGTQIVTSFGSGGTLNVATGVKLDVGYSTLGVGYRGQGSLIVGDGVVVSSYYGELGYLSGSTGMATITGPGSKWAPRYLSIGVQGSGTLTVADGGQVSSQNNSYLGNQSGSTGAAIVTGAGSQWSSSSLYVGYQGDGNLMITNGGFVKSIKLTIDFDFDGDSFINMATGGMLALLGDADGSLDEFFSLIVGTDAIRFWDASLSDWAPLTTATYGTDYTLRYLTEGDLAGYTLLTVGTAIPEPATWLLTLGLAVVMCTVRRCPKKIIS